MNPTLYSYLTLSRYEKMYCLNDRMYYLENNIEFKKVFLIIELQSVKVIHQNDIYR